MKRVLIAFFSAASAGAAAAQDVCTPAGWTYPVTEQQERAVILGRDFADGRHPPRPHYSTYSNFKDLLATLGLGALWPDAPRYGGAQCTGYSTNILLDRARELGPDHPYLAALAEVQVKLVRACTHRSEPIGALTEFWRGAADPDGRLDVIGRQDLAYLSAIRDFHARRFAEAREGFAAVAADAASPHRDAGRLMEIRALREMKEDRAAHALVKGYARQAQGRFKEWLDQQEDLIARKSDIPEFRAAHLEKVFRRTYGLPIEGEPAGFRREQAAYDLETYFLYEHDRQRRFAPSVMPADWWLHKETPAGSTAFAAVQAAAKTYDDIDWIVARHASRAFARDNSWFAGPDFDIADPAYQRVTDHAYAKWKGEGRVRWAAIVAARIDETSPYAPDIIAFISDMQERAQTCGLSVSEYAVYSSAFRDAVRLAAAGGDYDTAFTLMKQAFQNRFYPYTLDEHSVRRAFVNLLMIRGDYDAMRRFQTEIGNDSALDLWLAQTPEELVKYGQNRLLEFANMLDEEAILGLMALKDEHGRNLLSRQNEMDFARILWTRGYVFHDAALMTRTEPIVRARYPQLKPYFRHAEAAKSETARRRIFTHMILKYPGLSPFAYVGSHKRRNDLATVLGKDPIEGNWWCSGEDRARVQDDEDALADAFFRWRFDYQAPVERYAAGRRYRMYPPAADSDERRMIEAAWRRFRADYPPFAMISEQTQKRLAALPRASAYLWDEVRGWARSPAGYADWALQRDDRLPESLHRVVFTTRVSCHLLEEGNKETSRGAYVMLHRRYGGAFWAAQTPYWFDNFGYGARRR